MMQLMTKLPTAIRFRRGNLVSFFKRLGQRVQSAPRGGQDGRGSSLNAKRNLGVIELPNVPRRGNLFFVGRIYTYNNVLNVLNEE